MDDLGELDDLDDLPPLEAFAPETVEATHGQLTAPADETPTPAPLAAPAAAEDDFFGAMEELPVLELDSADLGPMSSDRDPDSLLALDQVELDGLEDIEVIESTEPTVDSALNLEVDSDLLGGGADAGAEADSSLTDSSFGRQVEAFTATSSGDIVEDLPEIEAVEDADEELAIALGDATADDGGAHAGHTGAGDDAGDNGAFAHNATDTTAGGIEPLAMGVVADANVAAQQFEAAGDAVALETPGVTEADAVVGGQAFVAGGGNGQQLISEAAGELDDQSFVAEGDAHAAADSFEMPDAAAEAIGAAHPDNGQSADDPGAAAPPVPPAAPPTPPRAGPGGGGGGFVIGTDLSSFIGGMPLVLPDLAPPPSAFGRVQVSFAGAKAPWEQAKRPSFPMGQSLAQDVTDAAEGLRDVESMDAEAEADGEGEQAVTEVESELEGLGEGAPGDEWDVAAAFEDDDEDEPNHTVAEWTAPAETEETAGADEGAVDVSAGDAQALTAHASPETIEQLQRQIDELEELVEPVDESLEAGDTPAELEAVDEDELLKELDADDDLTNVEPLSLEAAPTDEAPSAGDAAAPTAAAHAEAPPAAEVSQPQPLVDRSPAAPPPGVPPASKAAAAAAAAPSPMVVPPPPARVLRGGRKGAETPPPAPPPPAAPAAAEPDDMNGDAIFGSMEHGELGAASGPFTGVREVDVFSQGSPGGLGFENAPAAPATAAAIENRRPQRVIVPPRMGVAATTVDYDQPSESLTRPGYRVIPKKNIARRMVILVLLMLVLMGLAIAGIFYFMHPKQMTIGELQYQKTGALTAYQRQQLRQEQFEKLGSPQVMIDARTSIAAGGIPAGFLGDPIQFARGIKPEWPDNRASMTVSYTGPADPQDRQRLHALLMAMYSENHADLDREIHLKSNIAKLEKRIDEVKALKAQRDQLKKAVDAAPGPDEIQKLEAKAREADAAYDVAVAAVKDAQLAVRSAEEQLPPTSPGERSLNAAGNDPEKRAAADAELAALQKSLQAAQAQAAAVKGAASEEADTKRKMLDQAIEQFQQSAAGLVKEDPELARYVQAVQQLQEQTHKLSGDLIEVQQQQHKRLSALKKDVDDRVQARRTELWAADKSLGDLRAQLDLAQRKYNAANDSNFASDSPEVKRALADIRDLTGRIEARKMALGNDPIVTSVADGLQEMINITKERLEADRARIEKDIKNQELAFAQSNMVEKLPDTQRAQAAALKAKQEAINDLRKQYAAALDKRTAESNAALRDYEQQISAVTAKIDERKRLLAADNARNLTQQQEADRKANLEKAQAALKQADERAAAARQAYAQASRALTSAAARTTERTEKQQQLEAIDQSLAGALDQSKQDERQLESLNDQLKTLVTIAQPSEANIRVEPGRDDRWPYAAGAAVGMAVLFGIVAVFSVAGGDGGHRREQSGEAGDTDDDNADAGPLAIEQIGPGPATATNRNAQSVAG